MNDKSDLNGIKCVSSANNINNKSGFWIQEFKLPII